jgi:hypothetical protein
MNRQVLEGGEVWPFQSREQEKKEEEGPSVVSIRAQGTILIRHPAWQSSVAV